MALVLAVEPDQRQAAVLTRVISQRVLAELIVVDSRDAAIAALTARVPDVILLTALLSPRDEDEMLSHLRALAGADHVQTHTIPQLASMQAEPASATVSGGLLSKFRRKKESEPVAGCDPALFADEVSMFLARAAELKAHTSPALINRAPHDEERPLLDAVAIDPAAGPDESDPASSWSSPFEWRRGDASTEGAGTEAAAPVIPPLVSATPIAVAAAEDEQRREEADRTARTQVAATAVTRKEQARLAASEKERLRLEAAAAEREQDRLEALAAAEREHARHAEETRMRLEAKEAERERVRREAVAAEQERARLEAVAAAERERVRLEAEAAAKRERVRLAAAAAEKERARLEAIEAAERERARIAEETRIRLEAEAAERERVRFAAAAAEKERARLEAIAVAERARVAEETRIRIAAEAAEQKRLKLEAIAAEKERARLEAVAAAERERIWLEAEAAAARERVRLEAAATAERERARLAEETRIKLEAEAAERERVRLEAIAAAKEQARLEAAAAAEQERLRLEAVAAAKRERVRLEAEAAAAREQERLAAAAEVEREQRRIEEAAAARVRARTEREKQIMEAVAAARAADPFAEFRIGPNETPSLLRLMPLAFWARPESTAAERRLPAAGLTAAPPAAETPADELRDLMAGLSLPPEVAGVSYARGCRIRRVRVPASAAIPRMQGAPPVIVSKRALEQVRAGG